MDIKEIAMNMLINFFVIFFGIMLVIGVLSRLQGIDAIHWNAIFSLMALSALTVLPEFVFYSKRELTRLEWFVRHLICLLLVLTVVLLFINFTGGGMIISVGMTFIVYMMSFAIDFLRSVKSANQLTKKLKERYK